MDRQRCCKTFRTFAIWRIDTIEYWRIGKTNKIAKEATTKLKNLNFEVKRRIVVSVVDKIIGNQQKLQVYGYIPINQNVSFCSKHRHCRVAKRGEEHAF